MNKEAQSLYLPLFRKEVAAAAEILRRNKLRKHKLDREAYDGLVSVRRDVLDLLFTNFILSNSAFPDIINSAVWRELSDWTRSNGKPSDTVKIRVDLAVELLKPQKNGHGGTTLDDLNFAIFKPRKGGYSFTDIVGSSASGVPEPIIKIRSDLPSETKPVPCNRDEMCLLAKDVNQGLLIRVHAPVSNGGYLEFMYQRPPDGDVLYVDYLDRTVIKLRPASEATPPKYIGKLNDGRHHLAFVGYKLAGLYDVHSELAFMSLSTMGNTCEAEVYCTHFTMIQEAKEAK